MNGVIRWINRRLYGDQLTEGYTGDQLTGGYTGTH